MASSTRLETDFCAERTRREKRIALLTAQEKMLYYLVDNLLVDHSNEAVPDDVYNNISDNLIATLDHVQDRLLENHEWMTTYGFL